MLRDLLFAVGIAALAGCTSSPASSSGGTSGSGNTAGTAAGAASSGAGSTSSGTASSTGSSGTSSSGGSSEGPPGVALMSRLLGLWSGPANDTPVGSFPLLNMDLRPATPDVLFGRDDLDANDSLRFDFSIETYQGADTLIFRNGGYFLGLLRDTRTALVDSDDVAGTYHFCAETDAGCTYIDALFTFADADNVTLNVHVNGAQHLIWVAQQVQSRTAPTTFPADFTSQGDGTAPFPSLPTLVANVTWTMPLSAPATIWVLLSAEMCTLGSVCDISRSLEAGADGGATSAALTFDQLLPGTYYATAVIDVHNDLGATLAPSSGDQLSVPNAVVTVNPTDQQDTTALPIAITLP